MSCRRMRGALHELKLGPGTPCCAHGRSMLGGRFNSVWVNAGKVLIAPAFRPTAMLILNGFSLEEACYGPQLIVCSSGQLRHHRHQVASRPLGKKAGSIGQPFADMLSTQQRLPGSLQNEVTDSTDPNNPLPHLPHLPAADIRFSTRPSLELGQLSANSPNVEPRQAWSASAGRERGVRPEGQGSSAALCSSGRFLSALDLMAWVRPRSFVGILQGISCVGAPKRRHGPASPDTFGVSTAWVLVPFSTNHFVPPKGICGIGG